MGLIGERYPPPRLTRAAAALRRAAVSLGVIERRLADDPAGALPDLQRWRAAASSWQRPLRAAESRSLYNTNVLARWLDSGS